MGDNLTDKLDFEKRIEEMTALECARYGARQIYTLNDQVAKISKKIDNYMTPPDRKVGAISGGVAGTISAGIVTATIAIIEYFRGR